MKIGLNSDGMQKANRNLIIDILFENGPLSRIELAHRTHLKKATITNIINEFLSAGIVAEMHSQRDASGRKIDLLALNAPKTVILSARILRELFDVRAFSFTGELLAQRTVPINKDEDIETTLFLIFSELDKIIACCRAERILGLCMGLPGPYIRDGRNVAIVTGFEQLAKVDIQKELEHRYPFFCITEHDAKLSAFAEWKTLDQETRAKEECLIAIQSIGIGIGSGMIINGHIFHGAVGIAGEIGHMGINFNGPVADNMHRGIYENYASTGVAARYISEKLYEFPDTCLTENSNFQEICVAAEKGDRLALAVLDKLAWTLSYGLCSIIFILNPNRIVLSQSYPSHPRFMGKIRENLKKMLYPELLEPLKLTYSVIETDTTILGGYYLIVDKLLKFDQLLDKIKAIETQP